MSIAGLSNPAQPVVLGQLPRHASSKIRSIALCIFAISRNGFQRTMLLVILLPPVDFQRLTLLYAQSVRVLSTKHRKNIKIQLSEGSRFHEGKRDIPRENIPRKTLA